MTERFSAPGATLVKLFGRPVEEAADFTEKATRVRDIGVRTAMVSRVFVTALSLVSALAQALVYGLGGYLAVTGQIEAGTVVTLALLLTRLYTPMTALANARVDVMSALVSFERVFEVLDLQPMISEKPDARDLPEGPVSVRLRDVRFGYPTPRRCRWPRWRRWPCSTPREGGEVLHGVDLEVPGGPAARARRVVGRGQVDHRLAGAAALRRRLRRGELAGVDVRDLSFAALRGGVGVVTQDGHLFHDTIRANLRYAAPGRHRRRAARRPAPGPARRAARLAARRARHGRGGARLPALRRRAPAADHRPAAARQAAGGDPRRGHRAPRLRVRGGRAGRAGRGAGGPHRDRHRAPALHDPRRRPDRVVEHGRIVERGTHESCSPPTAATPRCTAPSTRGRPPTTASSAASPAAPSATRRRTWSAEASSYRCGGADAALHQVEHRAPGRRRAGPSPGAPPGLPAPAPGTAPVPATGTSSRRSPAAAWRSSRARVARASAAEWPRHRSRNSGSVRSRRDTSSRVPSHRAPRWPVRRADRA